MSTIYAPAVHDLFSGSFPPLTPVATDVDRPRLLRAMRGSERFRESNILPYAHRPFDTRWLYADRGADREYLAHVAQDVQFLGVGPNGDVPLVTRRAAANVDALQLFPLTAGNLTADAAEYVRRAGVSESELFHHAIAVVAGKRGAAARIPLPDDKSALRDSALLGYRFASLFEEHEPLVAASAQEQALRAFGVPARIGKEARMLRGTVLRVDDRWATTEIVVARVYRGEELVAVGDLGGDEALALLGNRTCDIYLNEKALWRNVPVQAWRYTHRGVPLLRAWLRDRTAEALGRGLLREEVTQFSTAVRRVIGLLMLQPALAKNASA